MNAKVLFLDAAPWTGGAQLSLAQLLRCYAGAGGQAMLLAADRGAGGLLETAADLGLRTGFLPARHWSFSPGGLAEFAADWRGCGRTLQAAVADFQPQFIHANGSRAGLLCLGRACMAGIPMVLHARDRREPALGRFLLGRRARCVAAISEFVAAAWRPFAGNGGVRVLYNGFDLEELCREAAPARSVWHGPGLFTVVLVADLTPWKNHRLFLEAVALAGRECPELRATLVGRPRQSADAAYSGQLRAMVKAKGLEGRVAFVDDASSALPWIAGADLLASAAANEPFGRTVVEGLALGRPVVAVRGGGPDEILAGVAAGCLCEPTPASLAAALLAWRDPRRRADIKAAARRRAADFSVTRLVAGLAEIYGKA